MGKKIMLFLIGLIIFVNIISAIYPICLLVGVTDLDLNDEPLFAYSAEDNHYVTRMEFLETLLKTIGITNEMVEEQMQNTSEDPMVIEIYHPDKYGYIIPENNSSQSQENVWINVLRYEAVCRIAANNNCLQVYANNVHKGSNEYEFRGTNFITVNEAIAMIQACLSDTDSYFGMIDKKSIGYKKLCLKARLSGILMPYDCAWWSFFDAKIRTKDMNVLLARLSNVMKRNSSINISGRLGRYVLHI